MDDPFCLEIFHGVGNLRGIRVEQSKVLGGAIFPQESVEIAIRSKLLYLSLYMDSILGSIYGIWSVYVQYTMVSICQYTMVSMDRTLLSVNYGQYMVNTLYGQYEYYGQYTMVGIWSVY